MKPDIQELLKEWSELSDHIKKEIRPILKKEVDLRKEIFAHFFNDPKEGTNYGDLANGWRIKGVYKLDRKIDEAALPAVQESLRKIGVNPDLLVEWKPSLKLAIYKELTNEQRIAFDEALITKPGSPTVELVPPKEK